MPTGFDPARLRGMLEVLDREDVVGFARDYVEDSTKHINALSDAVQGTNLDAARRAAHTLRAAAGLFGAVVLERRCHALELAALNGRLPTTYDVGEVTALRDRSVVALEQLLDCEL